MQISLVHYTAHLLDRVTSCRQAGCPEHTAGPWTAGCESPPTCVRTNAPLYSNLRRFTPSPGTLPLKPFIVSGTKALIYHANAFRSRPPSSYLNYVDLSRLSTARRCGSSCLLSGICPRSILHAASGSRRRRLHPFVPVRSTCTKYIVIMISLLRLAAATSPSYSLPFRRSITNVLCLVNSSPRLLLNFSSRFFPYVDFICSVSYRWSSSFSS